ncbi:MAG TPA: 2-oxo acid dehydrogenase subunit E2 [Euzebyales bacterium]|nr:2-oxo acid dehydrogenase subunit E2 [Euzebyales bacterium]
MSDGARGDRRYRVVPYPRQRQPVLDVLATAARQYTIHGLIEVDVTTARERLTRPAHQVSFTAFVVATVARAVTAHPQVNARRVGHRLVLFDDVDVVVTIERPVDGAPTPMPTILHGLDRQSCADITGQISTLRQRPVTRAGDLTGNRLLATVPGVIRRLALRAAGRVPAAAARFAPPIGISSLGMFDAGGWGIPLSPMTLMVTVGGIIQRPALIDGELVERELLPLTLSFDHAVVDGAPAARFAATLRRLFESAAALDGAGTDHDSHTR